jgi:hypothetical protein
MRRLFSLRGAFVILGALASCVSVEGQTGTAAQDPRIGTWTLNLEKSQFTPGSKPRMQVRQLQSRPDGFVVFTQIGLDGQGNPTFIQTTYKLDGKGYPEYNQNSLAEFAAAGTKPLSNTYRLVDANTVEIARLDATGKVMFTNTQTMSADGKTVTVTGGRRPVQVWDKQ